MDYLTANFGFKGETGLSAYELAVKNGYIGDEQTWLASLGTSSHFSEDAELYTATSGQTVFNLPAAYTSNSFIDIYKNGLRLNSTEYTIDNVTRKVTLTTGATTGDKVNIVCLTMSTNSLPIVSTISSSSTNDEALGALLAYNKFTAIENDIDDIEDDITSINTSLSGKLNTSNISVITGNRSGIAAGSTITVDVSYPTGFNQSNTLVISKMASNDGVYYDTANEDLTASGFPMIKMVALTSTGIRIWLKNTNSNTAKIGYYKLAIMKVS